MIDIELFQQALVRVQNGQTITAVIENLYKNRRGYRERTTQNQRAELTRARTEYLVTVNKDKKRSQPPRLFVETTPELKQAVQLHCQQKAIPVAQFVNNAVRQALRSTRGPKS